MENQVNLASVKGYDHINPENIKNNKFKKLSEFDKQQLAMVASDFMTGNTQKATQRLDAFAKDKKMDRIRNAIIRLSAIVTSVGFLRKNRNIGSGVKFLAEVADVPLSWSKKLCAKSTTLATDFVNKNISDSGIFKKLIKNQDYSLRLANWLENNKLNKVSDLFTLAASAGLGIPAAGGLNAVGDKLDEIDDSNREAIYR